ncbi:MAG: hypothetical protein L6V95_12850 [Candidatus Melainabacteria bacterium]|nr:MAG: hypothetical protein L6V95_12850 [Candidatus Melainabacteria bacterium]
MLDLVVANILLCTWYDDVIPDYHFVAVQVAFIHCC